MRVANVTVLACRRRALVTASQPPALVPRWRTSEFRAASHKPISVLSLWTCNPTKRVLDLPLARLLDEHAAAASDRLVARHTLGAQSTVVLEASRLKSSHLV